MNAERGRGRGKVEGKRSFAEAHEPQKANFENMDFDEQGIDFCIHRSSFIIHRSSFCYLMVNRLTRFRLVAFVSLVLLIPIGYGLRFYLSAEQEWLRNLLGNVAYESFWILLVVFLFPTLVPLKVAIGVCLATFAIEFLQLWQSAELQALRATLPGRLVLGSSFDWLDFPQYAIGSFVGWLWVRAIKRSVK